MTNVGPKMTRRAVLAGMAIVGGCARKSEPIVVPPDFAVRRGLAELEEHFASERFLYVPEARAWLVPVTGAAVEAFRDVGDPALESAADVGYLALYQKCPHLGCRVPSCDTSGLLECPCHGSTYTRYGELLRGPSERGLDRFVTWIDGEDLVIEPSQLIQGTPPDFHPSGEQAIGPRCIGDDSH